MASERELIQAEIDKITRGTGLGSLSDAYGHMLFGINHRGLGNPVNANQDNSGIVFFTRPNLNLSYDNLGARRTFMPLASDNIEHSIQRYVRVALDPVGSKKRYFQTPLFNDRNWFIPVLTNNLLSLSGWPDRSMEVFTTKPGVRKEVITMLNGMFEYYGHFTLTGNFRNVVGNPIPTMISAYLRYAEAAFLGDLFPHPVSVAENEMDNTIRIFILILDGSRRFVQTIGSTLAVINVDNIGAMLNFTGDETFQQSTGQLNVNFECDGLEVNDPILIEEFNDRAAEFDPGMQVVGWRSDGTVQLAGKRYLLRGDEIRRGNYYGVPLIHPFSQELMWFVTEEEYNEINR